MLVIYEDDILNLLIITYYKLFKEIPDSSFHKININSTEKSVLDLIKASPNDTVVIIYSGSVFLNLIGDNIRVIAKDYPKHSSDDIICENWHDYWAGAISEVDEEVCKCIYEYYHKISGVMTRRIVEGLKVANERSTLKSLIYSNSINNLQHQGRFIIEKLQPLLKQDNDASIQKTVEGYDCIILLTNFIEAAFQLIDRGHDNVLVCKINLNEGNVLINIISKNNCKIFENYLVYTRGSYKYVKIPLKLFVELVN